MKTFGTENAVVAAEIAYIIAKVMNADNKKKDSVCHYSSLYRATISEFENHGIEIDALGKHGYRFHVPHHRSNAYKYLKEAYGDKGFENAVVSEETDYIIEKIRSLKDKLEKKDTICHYSHLLKGTLEKLETMGIVCDNNPSPYGSSYCFHYPTKKSKAWYRLNMYGKVNKNK